MTPTNVPILPINWWTPKLWVSTLLESKASHYRVSGVRAHMFAYRHIGGPGARGAGVPVKKKAAPGLPRRPLAAPGLRTRALGLHEQPGHATPLLRVHLLTAWLNTHHRGAIGHPVLVPEIVVQALARVSAALVMGVA